MSANPRIGKVLRIPIELVPEDESKVDEMIKKIGVIKGQKTEDTAVSGSIENEVKQTIEEITGYEVEDLMQSIKITEQVKASGVNDMISLTKDQMSNLIGIAKNPSGAILGMFMSRFARGAGAIALALIIMEAIQYAINYMMRDGMPLDRRFKRYVQNEVFSFLDRLQKQQLRHGYRSFIVTTIGGLRGGQGQIGGNLYSIVGGTINQKIPVNQYVIPTGKTKGIMTRGASRYGRR